MSTPDCTSAPSTCQACISYFGCFSQDNPDPGCDSAPSFCEDTCNAFASCYTTKNYFQAEYADTFWLMICGMLVLFMQCGFALLEAGTVREKNTKNILLKNMLDACVGCMIWWSFGYVIAFGPGSRFIGGSTDDDTQPSLFLWAETSNEDSSGFRLAFWFFQYVFAATASTIVSGAMAERTTITAYLIYTTFITIFVYPVVVHWAWSSDGWISAFSDEPFSGGVMDFAGSGVVHMTGGIAALCGAAVIRPRKGRFLENGRAVEIPGHSTTLQVTGTFMLWLGWYGFNPGSTLGLSSDNYTRDAARIMVTTTLSAAICGITTCFISYKIDGILSTSATCNGILSGLVSITAGCSVVYPWQAAIIGVIGSFVYLSASTIVLNKCKVDDPLDAFAVHGACGAWGVISTGLFAAPSYQYNIKGSAGLFYGDTEAFSAAIIFVIAVFTWVSLLSSIMFLLLKGLDLLRISTQVEEAGLDVSKHGGSAYPVKESNIQLSNLSMDVSKHGGK